MPSLTALTHRPANASFRAAEPAAPRSASRAHGRPVNVSGMEHQHFFVDNGDDWLLDIKRYISPARRRPGRPPLLFVPGYCMNTFILAFHPSARSLVAYLADAGYEVWTANLRTQGDARTKGTVPLASFSDWCDVDVPTAIDFVLKNSTTGQSELILLGCSLGGTVVYGYLARRPHNHRLRAAVAMGAPLQWPPAPRWTTPLLAWPQLLRWIRLRGTRSIARTLLPIARRVPSILSVYMNTEHIALDRADLLTKTVDDPDPGINEDLVRWIRQRDLFIGPTNVTTALAQVNLPILSIYANGDGIVPPRVARRVVDLMPAGQVTTLEVGDDKIRFAHADMFINHHAESRVFAPLHNWLEAHQGQHPRGESTT